MIDFIPVAYVPLFIFLARILDVSLGTLRIMFVSKGLKRKATLLGFVEVLLWIIVVAQIFQNLDNWVNYVAYAAGFAAGTYIGMTIEEKMKVGMQIFRIIAGQESSTLIESLKEAGFRFTEVDAKGKHGSVKIIFTVILRKRWSELADLVGEHAPNSFYSVEDVKYASFMDQKLSPIKEGQLSRLLKFRKGK